MAGKTFVKFVAFPGIISVRSISKEEWAKIGIDFQDVSFDNSNRFMNEATAWPEDVMDYFRGDSEFEVVAKDDTPPPLAGNVSGENPSVPTPAEKPTV